MSIGPNSLIILVSWAGYVSFYAAITIKMLMQSRV